MRTLTLKAISERLSPSSSRALASRLCRAAKAGSLACDRPTHGEPLFSEAEVRAWLDANPPKRGPGAAAPAPAVAELHDAPLTDDERDLLTVLRDASATPVQKCRASFAMASLTVAKSYETGSMGAKHLEDLKKQGEELRRAESDYLELAERDGSLVPLETVCAMLGQSAAMLVATLDNYIQSLPVQIEIWRSDAAFQATDADGRGRTIRAWADDQARRLRTMLADTVETRIREATPDA